MKTTLINKTDHRSTVKRFPRNSASPLLKAISLLLLLLVFSTSGHAAGFNFGTTGGANQNGSFNGYVAAGADQFVGSTIAESTIPPGISGFTVTLTANADVDVELWDSGTRVVGWGGLIDSPQQVSGQYGGMTITWSGYNGLGGNPGRESITISGTTTRALTMRVFGYQAGSYSVVYTWSAPNAGGGSVAPGNGTFSGYVAAGVDQFVGSTITESTIPPGISSFTVTLTANADVDVELWDGGTRVVGWGGLIDSAQQVSGQYGGMTITWSGYNGLGGNPGRESITISGTTTRALAMSVFGYQAGSYVVTYSWGGGGGSLPPTTGAKAQLIEMIVSSMSGLNGRYAGQCKYFLSTNFTMIANNNGFKNADGHACVMPLNVTQDSSTSNWRWMENANSSFFVAAQVPPSTANKSAAMKELLKQAKRGDYVQLVGWNSDSLHTILFLEDYKDAPTGILAADSNLRGDGVVRVSRYFEYSTSTALRNLANFSSVLSRTGNSGATLYRLKDSITK